MTEIEQAQDVTARVRGGVLMIDPRLPRADEMKRDAFRIIDDARREHFGDHHTMTAAIVLFSGGNDSTVLAHLMRHEASHFAHCNTTIGVEETRQFVRDVAADWHMPLIEETPDPGDRYADLVAERGFPGPGQHFKMYQRLKERSLRKIRRRFVADPLTERVLFIAGRRRDESERRKNIPEHEREGSIVWVSPLANWTDADMKAYREANPDVPRNEVTDHLHMSGECLCGAFAKKGEYDLLRLFYPTVADELDRLSQLAQENGAPPERCRWGWGAYRDEATVDPNQMTFDLGPLCSSCEWKESA